MRAGRPALGVAATLVAVPLLFGCGADAPAPQAASGSPTASAAPSATPTDADTRAGSGRASRTGATASPSLPPGDPGLDAPSVPDPGVKGAGKDHHDEEPLREVPTAAMLTTDDLAQMTGGSWRTTRAEAAGCTELSGAVASRVTGYAEGGGAVLEAVTTHRDARAADRAVLSLRSVLGECGWDLARDPRLGSASVAATRSSGDQTERLTAVSVEGVGMVLVGRGTPTTPAWQWDGIVDLAQGSVCPAAPDGCH